MGHFPGRWCGGDVRMAVDASCTDRGSGALPWFSSMSSMCWLCCLLFLGTRSVTAQVPATVLGPPVIKAEPTPARQTPPDFGPNVLLFSPGMDATGMQRRIDDVYRSQQHSEFGPGRYALLFAPGAYHLNVPIGFYTQVSGLGAMPDDVTITGNVHVDAAASNNNATTTFWRSAENFAVEPAGGTMQWAVSQAVAFRRMHVHGGMRLNQDLGWASGGWMSDTIVDGEVNSGTQQQWISRNTQWGKWTGSNWNMVFVGVTSPPVGEWPKPPFTVVANVPVLREKPFLQVDQAGRYSVRVPGLERETAGVRWREEQAAGRSVPIADFYIARPERDSAESINRALGQGKHLLLTPGTYLLTEPLRVTHKGTVVLGMGFATLKPIRGTEAMVVSDVDGISLAGLLFDAGPAMSHALLRVGEPGSHHQHGADPIGLYDIFVRVGGAGPGATEAGIVLNSDDTLIDQTWIWRADHGDGVGWTANPSRNGLVVNGNRVTIYGLFVEHLQQHQVLWNGEYGRTYFYQSEIPYDPPTQPAWMDANGARGWASYKVAEGVKHHQAWGLGVYSVFRHPDVVLDRAIEVPVTPQVQFQHMITVALDNLGAIRHVINDTGESTQIKPRVLPTVTSFPPPH